ncbi:hypothetical protein IJG04_01510 [Candidatus Saccharibacteria bacterium]|nr:hypothetical protein [Candidatus Saccharibacteria bacterium]
MKYYPLIHHAKFHSESEACMNSALIGFVTSQLIRPEFNSYGIRSSSADWRVRIEDACVGDDGIPMSPNYVLDFGKGLLTELPVVTPDTRSEAGNNFAILKVEYHETDSVVPRPDDSCDSCGPDDLCDEHDDPHIEQHAGLVTIIVVVEGAPRPEKLMEMSTLIAGFYDEMLRELYPASFVLMNRSKLRVTGPDDAPVMK